MEMWSVVYFTIAGILWTACLPLLLLSYIKLKNGYFSYQLMFYLVQTAASIIMVLIHIRDAHTVMDHGRLSALFLVLDSLNVFLLIYTWTFMKSLRFFRTNPAMEVLTMAVCISPLAIHAAGLIWKGPDIIHTTRIISSFTVSGIYILTALGYILYSGRFNLLIIRNTNLLICWIVIAYQPILVAERSGLIPFFSQSGFSAVPLYSLTWIIICLAGNIRFELALRKGLAADPGIYDRICDTYGLSDRYRLVLYEVVKGAGNKEIAVSLDLSVKSVHNYIVEMYRRLGVNSRQELLELLNDPAWASRGLLSPMKENAGV